MACDKFCPKEVLTSAPGGSDSNRNASVAGDGLRKLRLGVDAEQATRAKPHATTAMARMTTAPHRKAIARPGERGISAKDFMLRPDILYLKLRNRSWPLPTNLKGTAKCSYRREVQMQ
jgi:hypothetical protein